MRRLMLLFPRSHIRLFVYCTTCGSVCVCWGGSRPHSRSMTRLFPSLPLLCHEP
ncbi:5'-3' exoribonuclease 3 [Zea mays]|uniref:5'-3' exoribonuclease 3 n=1 Tax=Zea mays TaxID=4577 RepID=A0A1D6FJM5_MAIZE|nr:5'-3' exoribonuclease 3 [Zea mays]